MKAYVLAWGKKVSPEFRARVHQICRNFGWPADYASYLMACMAFETGRTFSPSKKNPNSSATGLIQFVRRTAAYLGTSTTALSKMTAVQQLDYVEKYFQPYYKKIGGLEDMYMAILWPAAIGKPNEYVLWRKGTAAYKVNAGLDVNGNGYITKGEACSVVRKILLEGFDHHNGYT